METRVGQGYILSIHNWLFGCAVLRNSYSVHDSAVVCLAVYQHERHLLVGSRVYEVGYVGRSRCVASSIIGA